MVLFSVGIAQPLGIGFSWDTEHGFSVYPVIQGYGLEAKHAPAWCGAAIDGIRANHAISENPALDRGLFALSYALRLYLPCSQTLENDNLHVAIKVLALGAQLLYYYLNEDAGLPVLPLIAKKGVVGVSRMQQMIDRYIAEHKKLPSAHDIASDPVFVSCLQDMFADICHVVTPLLADKLATTYSPEQARSLVKHVSYADIAFMSRLIIPIILLRAHFGVWMPDMVNYLSHNIFTHIEYRLYFGAALVAGRFALKKCGLARQNFENELSIDSTLSIFKNQQSIASVVSTNETNHISENIDLVVSGLTGKRLHDNQRGMQYSRYMSPKMIYASIYMEGQRLIFNSRSVAQGFIYHHPRYGDRRIRYPSIIDSI